MKTIHKFIAASICLAALLLASTAPAAISTWTGANAALWGTGSNWSTGNTTTISDDLTILGPGNANGTLTINIAAAAAANTINFTNISGNSTSLTNTTSGANQTLTLQTGLTVGTGAVTIGSSTANQSVNIALGANNTWTIGTGGLTVNNIISGVGFGITKNGTGTLTLAGANTYNGSTTITAGTVQYSGNTSMSSGSAITMAAGTTLALASDSNATFTPAIFTGAAGAYTISVNQLTGNGTGKTLTLANNFTAGSSGNLTVSSTSGDTLQLSNQFTFNSAAATINLSGANLTLSAGVNISGNQAAALTVNAGSNTLTINGNYTTATNRYGTITINNGTVTMANGQNGGSSTNWGVAATLNGGTLNLNNAAAIGGAGGGNSLTLTSGTLDNTSGSTKTLSNNVAITLGGNFAFSTSAGTSNSSLNLGTGAVTNSGNRTITLNGAGNLTFGGVMTNTLAGNNTLTVNNGSGTTATSAVNFGGYALGNSATSYVDVINGSGTVNITGVISDGNATATSGLTYSGTGKLNLSGNNTYRGATLVSGGTLAVTSNSINTSSGVTINGSGAKYVYTSSTAGTNAITLTQGTLDGTATVGNVTVADLAANTVQNGNGTGTGTLTIGKLTFNGNGTLNIFEVGTTKGIGVTGALITANNGLGSITVNATNSSGWTTGTTYDLITYGSLTGGITDFAKGTISGLTGRQSSALGNSTTAITLTVNGDTPVWSGANSSVLVQYAVNTPLTTGNLALKTGHTATDFWTGDNVEFNETYNVGAGDVAVTRTTVNINGGSANASGIAATSVTFNNSAIDYTITSSDGTGITAGTLIKNGTGNLTITNSNSYNGTTTINAGKLQLGNGTTGNDGALTATSGVTNNATLAYNLFGNSTAAYAISGSGSVTKSGAGTLTLNGTNSYSGGTTINGGIVQAGSNSALGATTGNLSFGASSSGKLQVNGKSLTVGSLNGDSTAIIENSNATAGTLTVNSTGTDSFAGVIQNGSAGTLALAKGGAGTLILTGAGGNNTFNGTTTINAGTLQYNAASAMSTGSAITVNAGGTLALASDGNTTFTPASLTGGNGNYTIAVNQLTGAGAGKTLTLANAGNAYVNGGTITISSTSGDTLAFSSALSIPGSGTTTLALNGANMTLNGVNNAPNAQATGFIVTSTGNNTLTINGNWASNTNRYASIEVQSGTLTMNNTQSNGGGANYGPATTLTGGTLNINNAGAVGGLGGGNFLTLSGGTLDNTSGSAKTLSNNPTVSLNGNFAFGGSSDLNLGTAAASLGAAAGTTRTITTNGAGILTVGGVIANGTTASSLTKAGSGTLILSGNNTYGGTTTVSLGTLILTGTNTNAGLFQTTGGTLALTGTGAINSASGITVNGSGAKFVTTSSVASTPAITLTQGTVDGKAATVGNVTVADLAANTVQNGNGTGTGTLTIGNLTFNGNGTLNIFEVGTTKGIGVTGALTTANTGLGEILVNASNSAAWTTGTTYDLITYGSLTGGITDFAKGTISGLTGRQSSALGNSGTAITLIVSGDTPVWSGAASNVLVQYAVNTPLTTGNLALKTGYTATDFWTGDNVEFNETYNVGAGDVAVTRTTVNINGGSANASGIAATSVTFNNSAIDYTITSSDGTGITAGLLIKNGTGNLTITNSNSYNGTTTINAGKLQLGNGTTGNDGALAGTSAVINNSALVYNLFGNSTASYPISGNGSVTKTGAGTVVLSGSNTYSGNTTITNGTLKVGAAGAIPNGSGKGNVVFDTAGNTAIFDINGNDTTINGLSQASVSSTNKVVNNAVSTNKTLTVGNGDATSTFAGIIANNTGTGGTLALTKTGTGTLILAGNNTYTGATTINAGTLQYNAASAMSTGSAITVNAGGTLALASDTNTTFTPASLTGPGSGNYTISVNQLTGAGANKTLTLANYNGYNGGSPVALTVSSTSGDTLLLSSAFRGQDWGVSTTINLNNANLVFNNGVSGQDPLIVVTSSTGNSLTINGNVGGLSANEYVNLQVNSGVLTLNNTVANPGGPNWGVNIALNGGTLNINNAGAINGAGGGGYTGNTLALSGGTLDNTSGSAKTMTYNPVITLGGDFAFSTSAGTSANNLNLGTGTVALGNATRTITTNGAATLTLGGVVSGSAAGSGITKDGTGTLILAGNNTYTGATTISAGTLQIGSGTNAGSIASSANIVNNAALVYNVGNGTRTYGNVISGTGSLTQNSAAGTLILTGNNSYSGTTIISAGTLQVGNGTDAGTIASSASITNNGSLVYNVGSGNRTYGNAISGTGALTQNSAGGTLILSGNNTYTGTTTVSSGTLLINGSTSASSAFTVNSGTLGGNGTIAGSVTVNGGTIAPGNSPGVLTVGSLALNSTSTTAFEINGTTAAGTDYDRIVVTPGGALSLNGNFTIAFGASALSNTTINLFNYTTTHSGDFASLTSTGYYNNSGAAWNHVGETFSMSYSGQTLTFDEVSGNLEVVPEPSTWALLAFSLTTVMVLRRRRKD